MNKGRLLVIIQFVCLGVLVLSSGNSGAQFQFLSRMVVVAAFLIGLIAVVNLRDALTIFPEPKPGAPFVTRGIYHFVRHPMYLAVLLFAFGEVIGKFSIVTVLVYVVLLIDLHIKYRYEDALLLARWPAASEYQKKVGALLPKVFAK